MCGILHRRPISGKQQAAPEWAVLRKARVGGTGDGNLWHNALARPNGRCRPGLPWLKLRPALPIADTHPLTESASGCYAGGMAF